MTYVKCQIATMGLIPKIHVRGPVANIELDVDTINELVDRGVIILFADGSPITRLVEKDGKVTNVTDVKVATAEDAIAKGQLNVHGHSACFKETIVKKEDPVEETADPLPKEPPIGPLGTHRVSPIEEDPKQEENPPEKKEENADDHKDHVDEGAEDPHAKEGDEGDEDEGDDEPEPATTPSGNPNPYAGMSRNQAKKARRAAAKKAAEDAARVLGQPTPPAETQN